MDKPSANNPEPIKQTQPLRPSPTDFDNFLPWACAQLEVDTVIIITRSIQSYYLSTKVKDRTQSKESHKSKSPIDTSSGSHTEALQDEKACSNFGAIMKQEKTVHIETIYDKNSALVQLKFKKLPASTNNIPRLVMKVISFIIPFHRSLSSIIINKGLHAEVIYEMSNFLPNSLITEIILDYTYLEEANYNLLLKNNVLKHLSLSKCSINDMVVKNIASELAVPCPASKSLSALNLSSNRITDEGVKYLAEVLRSNRHLSYLNLADNMITDEGATSIFSILVEFALTKQETKDRSDRRVKYLQEKQKLVLKSIKKFTESTSLDSVKRTGRRKQSKLVPVSIKKKTVDKETSTNNGEVDYYTRADIIAEGILGPFKDPFGPENTELRGTVVYCYGNNSLSYLNLAYNNLTLFSVQKLCEVVKTQHALCRSPKGLISIRIEGNYMPGKCEEFKIIDNLLMSGLPISSSKRKTPVSKMSSKRIV